MKEITVSELAELKKNNEDFILIDVREPHEYEQANLDAKSIPLQTVVDHLDEFPKDAKKIIVHCRSGKRSARACQIVEANQENDNLYNLVGGILAYAKEIDPSLNVS